VPRYLAAIDRTAIRKPTARDEDTFVAASLASRRLHEPWITSPSTPEEYAAYLRRLRQRSSFGVLVIDRTRGGGDALAGWITLSQIARASFQSAYTGYAAFVGSAGRGHMTEGLTLFTRYCFFSLGLHRLEVNIQPDNLPSKALVKRCGFRHEGYSPDYLYIAGAWRDHERWALTKEMLKPAR
jgi:[ribosomal protein S5]-alanine N-acetyltransferase